MARFQRGTEIRDVVREGDGDDDHHTYCERQRELLLAGWRRSLA